MKEVCSWRGESMLNPVRMVEVQRVQKTTSLTRSQKARHITDEL